MTTATTAEARASELFNLKQSEVPPAARAYAAALCRKHGACAEVILTAHAHHAQISEGLSCVDPLYLVNDETRRVYTAVTAGLVPAVKTMDQVTVNVLAAASWLSEALSFLHTKWNDPQRPPSPAEFAADPTLYARDNYVAAMQRLCTGGRKLLLVGMNPGPHGMAQTGVPFGDVSNARVLLGRRTQIDEDHPTWTGHKIVGLGGKVLLDAKGLDYHRGEVSGERLWGAMQQLFGSLDAAFDRICVINYCPLLFLDNGGANVTPSDFPKTDGRTKRLTDACDEHLRRVVAALGVKAIVGIGNYSHDRCRIALRGAIPVTKVLHPSPRNASTGSAWLSLVAGPITDALNFAESA